MSNVDIKYVSASIEARAADFIAASDKIWALAETGMAEHKSAQLLCSLCEKLGFAVERGVCGMPTAFTARRGSGKPVIGFLGEYDALGGLSQRAGACAREALAEGGSGHGCGHNLLGVGALAAAYGLAEYLESNSLGGTVIFYGCPGEESGSGKAFMARDGLFSELDCALSWHPDDRSEVMSGTSNSCIQKEYIFEGVASHAAESPELGRSALDAVELMNIGAQFLREHMPSDARIHYAITDAGGLSPNVVPARAKVTYMIRSIKVRDCLALVERVDDIARGAALMTSTELSTVFIDGLANLRPNYALERVLGGAMRALGAPGFDESDFAEAAALAYSFEKSGKNPLIDDDMSDDEKAYINLMSDSGAKPLCDFSLPLRSREGPMFGSTDVGDVSQCVPTAQIRAATWPIGTPAHSWQAVSCGKSAYAHKATLFAAKTLAAAGAALVHDPELLERARAEFDRRAAEEGGYPSPLPDDAKPVNL